MESWREIGNLDSKRYHVLLNELGDITSEARNISRSLIGEISQYIESL